MKKFFHKFSTILKLDLEHFIVFFRVSYARCLLSKFSASGACCMHPIMLFPHELKDEFQGHEKCVDDEKCGKESKRNQVNTVKNITSARAEILLQYLSSSSSFLTTSRWSCLIPPCYLIPFSSSSSFFLFFPIPVRLESSFPLVTNSSSFPDFNLESCELDRHVANNSVWLLFCPQVTKVSKKSFPIENEEFDAYWLSRLPCCLKTTIFVLMKLDSSRTNKPSTLFYKFYLYGLRRK